MTTPNVKVGIVGLGRLGKRHAENLAFSVRGAELVAACSPDADEPQTDRLLRHATSGCGTGRQSRQALPDRQAQHTPTPPA